jgi:hypothetical protein
MNLKFWKQHWMLYWVAGIGLALSSALTENSAAIASQQIVLKYKIFQRSLPVQDLTTLSETGGVSKKLQYYIDKTHQDPEKVRQTLTQNVEIDPVTLDRVLNSPAGDALLDQLSKYIYTPSHRDDRQALRAALSLSASNDRQINLLEIMQNYPTPRVYLDGERLLDAYQDLKSVQEQVRAVQGPLEELLRQIKL